MEDSIVDRDATLDEYLFGEDGYLINRDKKTTIVFMDGKFHSQHDGRFSLSDEEFIALGCENNSIPFMFSYAPPKNQSPRERKPSGCPINGQN